METFFPLAAILNVFCHVLLYGLECTVRFPNACTKENNNKKMQRYQQWAAMPAAQSHTSGPMLWPHVAECWRLYAKKYTNNISLHGHLEQELKGKGFVGLLAELSRW